MVKRFRHLANMTLSQLKNKSRRHDPDDFNMIKVSAISREALS